MHQLIILLFNLIYIPAIWYGVIVDDAMALMQQPFPVRRTKATSVLLHIVVAQFVYFAFGSTPQSFIAALLFSMHPLGVQIPVYYAAQHYGLNALIFLIVWAFAPFACLLYFLAIPGIGTVMLTPLVFAFTEHWRLALLLLPLILFSYKDVRSNIRNKISGETDDVYSKPLPQGFALQEFHWAKLIIVVKTFGYYALACLLPIKNGFYNSFLVTMGASEKQTKYWFSLNRHFWGGLFALVLMIVLWWLNKSNLIGAGIMLFVLSLIPFLNFITVQMQTASRFAYLPLIGFHIALANILLSFGTPGLAVACLLIGGYIAQTIRVMQLYKTDSTQAMIVDSHEFPDNPRVWYYRYERAMSQNNHIIAWAEAAYGLKYLPYDCQLWFGLAVASYHLGDLNAAKTFLENAEENMMLLGREDMTGKIYEMKKRVEQALKDKWQPPKRGFRQKGRFG